MGCARGRSNFRGSIPGVSYSRISKMDLGRFGVSAKFGLVSGSAASQFEGLWTRRKSFVRLLPPVYYDRPKETG